LFFPLTHRHCRMPDSIGCRLPYLRGTPGLEQVLRESPGRFRCHFRTVHTISLVQSADVRSDFQRVCLLQIQCIRQQRLCSPPSLAAASTRLLVLHSSPACVGYRCLFSEILPMPVRYRVKGSGTNGHLSPTPGLQEAFKLLTS
jgi:hypothetical protein